MPFFSLSGTNKLGSIEPETMEITEYVLPNPASRPRRIAITPDDVLWYTDNPRGYLGMYDPKTGTHKEWPSPSGAKSAPYGIATIGNIVWYNESGAKKNTLVRFDPKTEKFQSWLIPVGSEHGDVRTIVRNMMPSPQGTLWLALSGTNGIASVEVKE
jgi:virginiamycin B lyase